MSRLVDALINGLAVGFIFTVLVFAVTLISSKVTGGD